MDLGTLNVTGSGGSTSTTVNNLTTVVTAGPVATNSHFTDGILRAGLNYKFY
jgi:hypothetical protein